MPHNLGVGRDGLARDETGRVRLGGSSTLRSTSDESRTHETRQAFATASCWGSLANATGWEAGVKPGVRTTRTPSGGARRIRHG